MAVILIRLCKDGQLTGKTEPVFLMSSGTYINPVRELQRMLQLDPVPQAQRATTPLFRDASGQAFSRAAVSKMVENPYAIHTAGPILLRGS